MAMDDRQEREAALYSLSKYNEEILRLCEDSVEVLDAFEVLEIISTEEKDDANANDDYSTVLGKLSERMDNNPSFFVDFCCHLQGLGESSIKSLAESLLDTYSKATLTGQSVAPTPTPLVSYPTEKEFISDHDAISCLWDSGASCASSKVDVPLKKLKEQLCVFQGIPCESDDLKESMLKMTESALKSFISMSLDMGVDAQTVYTVLNDLYIQDVVIDDDVFQWCKTEIEKQDKIRNPDSLSLQDMSIQPLNEITVTKEVIQNSIFACHLLEQSKAETAPLTYPHSLFEVNRSSFLRLDDGASSNYQHKSGDLNTESKAAVHQYLIAKGVVKPSGHVIYYIAFSSHQNLKEWSDGHTSFEKGFKKQEEQLPLQFILERLWEGESVVLTGFSFGGILAHLCAINLWHLSQDICSELLERNLLCITFGQPITSLPKMKNFEARLADKSRFHAIYITDDKVPRMLKYLDPAYTEFVGIKVPEKFRSQISSDEIFQNSLSTVVMRQLIALQERNICQMANNSHHASKEVVQPPTGRRRTPNHSSVVDLRTLLRPLKRHRSHVPPSYITYKKLGNGELIECKACDLEFPVDADIHEELFTKHKTGEYLQAITNRYTKRPPRVKFDESDILLPSNFVRPSVKRLEIHHFNHQESTAALSLEGENLCFAFRFIIYLHKSDKKHEVKIDQKDSVSSRSIQIQKVPLSVPREFVSSTDSSTSNNEYQESEETANLHLVTHFGEFSFENVIVKHKKFFIPCRKQQVANLSIAEVIELSFLGALLERHPHTSSTSRRFKVIQDFFADIVEAVPIESAFSCLANMSSDQNARHLCHTLKRADIKPPLSLSFFINAALAITKLRGEAVQLHDISTLEDLFYVFFVTAKKRASPLLSFNQSTPPTVESDEGRYLKWFDPSIYSHSRNSDMVQYLQMTVDDAIKHSTGRIPAISGISIKSLFEATEALSASDGNPLPCTIKSPKSLLHEGQKKLEDLQDKAREKLKGHPGALEAVTKANNKILLEYVKKLRNEDLHLCIQIIIAFIEEQVRVPISDFHLAISYWQLLKLGLGIFRRKVSKDFITQYISVGKHIQNIAAGTGHTTDNFDHTSSVINSQYAGKLQFLLSASLRHDEPPLFDDKFLTYSLENHLYNRFTHATVSKIHKIDESTPLDEIEQKWDMLFKDVAMSTIVSSHRRLIARWLKFSLMMHKLRAELSCHATVGIIGLVNSGKSTLVKELFKIEGIETGTRAEKRTTVPFLYSVQGVENFEVIDFPGVDDQDDHISDLVNLIRTLSQLVVFVVNYRNAHTKAAVEWYRKLNQYAIPHLVCLTHGDRLYAECADEEQSESDPAYAKKAIKKQVEIIRKKIVSEVSDSPMRSVELYSLKVDNDSLLKSDEGQQNIRDAGIKGIKDVGRWIIRALEEHVKEKKTAQKLKSYLNLT